MGRRQDLLKQFTRASNRIITVVTSLQSLSSVYQNGHPEVSDAIARMAGILYAVADELDNIKKQV